MTEASWDLTQTDLMKSLFAKYANGKSFIEGEDAVRILSASRLSIEVLARIWDLSDIDDDGRLNTAEFVLAFHLCVCIAKRGLQLPSALPDILVKWHASQKDRKLPLFAKGHRVIHHRASDGLKRVGTVVGVHSDDIVRGFYYTVRLAADDHQELQANEDRLTDASLDDAKFVMDDNNHKRTSDGFVSSEPVAKKEAWAQAETMFSMDSFNDDAFGEFEEAAPSAPQPTLFNMPNTSFPSSSFMVGELPPKDSSKETQGEDDYGFGDFEAATQPSKLPSSTASASTQTPAPAMSSFLFPPMISGASSTNQNTSVFGSPMEVNTTVPVQEKHHYNQMDMGDVKSAATEQPKNNLTFDTDNGQFSFAPAASQPINSFAKNAELVNEAGLDSSASGKMEQMAAPPEQNIEKQTLDDDSKFEQVSQEESVDVRSTVDVHEASLPNVLVESAPSAEKVEVNLSEIEAIQSFDSFGTQEVLTAANDPIAHQSEIIAHSGLTSPDSFEAFDQQDNVAAYKSYAEDEVVSATAQESSSSVVPTLSNEVEQIAVNLDDLVSDRLMVDESPKNQSIEEEEVIPSSFQQEEVQHGWANSVSSEAFYVEQATTTSAANDLPYVEQHDHGTIIDGMTNGMSMLNNNIDEPADVVHKQPPHQQQVVENDFGFSTAFEARGGDNIELQVSSPSHQHHNELNESANNIAFGFDPMSPPHEQEKAAAQVVENGNGHSNSFGYPTSAFGEDDDFEQNDKLHGDPSLAKQESSDYQDKNVIEPPKLSFSAFDHVNGGQLEVNDGFGAFDASDGGVQQQQQFPVDGLNVVANNEADEDEFGEFQ